MDLFIVALLTYFLSSQNKKIGPFIAIVSVLPWALAFLRYGSNPSNTYLGDITMAEGIKYFNNGVYDLLAAAFVGAFAGLFKKSQ
jgi:hypothetical protein